MKKFRKFLALLLTAAMILPLFGSIPARADNIVGEPEVDLEVRQEGNQLLLVLESVDEFSLGNLSLQFAFDEEAFSVSSFTAHDGLKVTGAIPAEKKWSVESADPTTPVDITFFDAVCTLALDFADGYVAGTKYNFSVTVTEAKNSGGDTLAMRWVSRWQTADGPGSVKRRFTVRICADRSASVTVGVRTERGMWQRTMELTAGRPARLALQARGHNVGMTGDGVNDIPAMKAADCSIAMAGGSDAARHAAQITLLDSNFGVMPDIVLEGRRIINNITRAATLFLTKTIFSFLLSVLTLVTPGHYPFQPIQLTLISSMTVGIPGFFLAMEPSRERVQGGFLRTILTRALPGGIAIAVCAALASSLTLFGWDDSLTSTVATLVAGFVGFLILGRVCWPVNWKRAALIAAAAAGFSGAAMVAPGVFYLDAMTGGVWAAWGVLSALGTAVTLAADWQIRRKPPRWKWLEGKAAEAGDDLVKEGKI